MKGRPTLEDAERLSNILYDAGLTFRGEDIEEVLSIVADRAATGASIRAAALLGVATTHIRRVCDRAEQRVLHDDIPGDSTLELMGAVHAARQFLEELDDELRGGRADG